MKIKFKKNIKKFIENKDGVAYLETLVSIIVICMIFGFVLNVYPVLVKKFALNNFTNEIIREAELEGEIGDSLDKRIEELKKESGVNPDKISWNTTYIDGTYKVQLNNVINVTVEKETKIGFLDSVVKIPLKSKATGRSEVYWK
jgi:hypothetical protein